MVAEESLYTFSRKAYTLLPSHNKTSCREQYTVYTFRCQQKKYILYHFFMYITVMPRKVPVLYKFPEELLSRIASASRRLGYSRNIIVEDAVSRRLDELEGRGWRHPTCPDCYYCANGCENPHISAEFYCAHWLERNPQQAD